MVLDEATGATGSAFPFFSPVGGYVTDRAVGEPAGFGNGYVQTVSSGGAVLSTFGSSGTAGNGTHTGGPYGFYYTGQAVQGPDGTIYTADPLGTVEATSPTGLLEGQIDARRGLRSGAGACRWSATRSTSPADRAFDGGSDAVSTFSLASLQAYLAAPAAATDVARMGSRAVDSGRPGSTSPRE